MKPCDFGMCFHLLSHRAQFETQGFGHWAAHIYDEDPLKWVRAFSSPFPTLQQSLWLPVLCAMKPQLFLTLGLGEQIQVKFQMETRELITGACNVIAFAGSMFVIITIQIDGFVLVNMQVYKHSYCVL